ncbi:putative phage abortive infection protein [Pseudomonas aeruginosa]|uniref:putative phage abortive infection protein n=1 Tax=Pseudomonas aeruginosa TaxID=287 RepID=UPI002E1D1F8E
MEVATEANKTAGEAGSIVLWLGGVAAVVVLIVVLAAVVHFFFGGDIWWIEAKNTDTAAYWGQLGDFIGGMLNPVLSFFALLAVLLSLRSQSAELRAAREEAKVAQKILEQQTRIAQEQSKLFERQNFESSFFGLLEVFSKSVDSVTYFDGTKTQYGKQAFQQASKKYSLERLALAGREPGDGADMVIRYSEDTVWDGCRESFLGSFQLLLEILVYIDSFGSPIVSQSMREWRKNFIASLISDSVDTESGKKVYAKIIKATLSPGVKKMLAVYCMTKSGTQLCEYVGRFNLLDGYCLKINDVYFQEALRKVGAVKAVKTS